MSGKTEELDYTFPEELIAQKPASARELSRLLVLDRSTGACGHRVFRDFVDFIGKGDVVVLNDTKVRPARLFGQKASGARVEILLLKQISSNQFEALVKPRRRLRPGTVVKIKENIFSAQIVRLTDAGAIVELNFRGDLDKIIDRYGHMPLPPYIKREDEAVDKSRYQTVFAKATGASAAPTAGLHFTEAIIRELSAKGAIIAYVTLHVGFGTFQKISSEYVADHKMHTESFDLKPDAACAINTSRANNRKIFAVGTTTVRVLESCAGSDGNVIPGEGETDIFIYPPYQFRAVDCLVTNFHQPKTSLLCLVNAFAGKELIDRAYTEAINKKYRLFSYGDAMLIL